MANQTTEDNYMPAEKRQVPQVSREYTISLNADTQSVQLPEDVKTAVIFVSGADVEIWPSYNDGADDNLAGLQVDDEDKPGYSIQASPTATKIENNYTNAAAEKTVKNIPDGSTYEEAQEAEFNKINAKSAGTATVYIWPGNGRRSGVS